MLIYIDMTHAMNAKATVPLVVNNKSPLKGGDILLLLCWDIMYVDQTLIFSND